MADSNQKHDIEDIEVFRREIDIIDDQIVNLLKQRTEIVRKVGALKRRTSDKDCYIRSAREAHMHRDVYQRFSDGGIHPEAALAIWRHIITASTHMEKPLHVAAPEHLHRLVDHYFGSYIPCDDWQTTIPNAATILCAPFPSDASATYWQQLLANEKPWRIFSYAPLISDGAPPQALLLAAIDAEDSGDEISYFTGGTPPAHATMHGAGIWSVDDYITQHEGASFLGAHAKPILRSNHA